MLLLFLEGKQQLVSTLTCQTKFLEQFELVGESESWARPTVGNGCVENNIFVAALCQDQAAVSDTALPRLGGLPRLALPCPPPLYSVQLFLGDKVKRDLQHRFPFKSFHLH